MQTTVEVIQAAVTADQNGTKTLETAIQEAITEARATCESRGNTSPDCAVAWDIVEELQAYKASKTQVKTRKNPLEIYCEQHPDAIECLIYDV